ncbi:MAG: [NiFe]-hydrogenase assembly chaperone HybE [Burkholderiaceae bacterium]
MNLSHRFAPQAASGDPGSGRAGAVGRPGLDGRVQQLVDCYRRVQAERMQDVPILNPVLKVEAVGFAWADLAGADGAVAEGVLVTPWFMSLVRLPAQVQAHGGRVARKAVRDFGSERFEFIGAHDACLGYHETCALFSPMGDFRSLLQARETAEASLALLRARPGDVARPAPVMVPSRRAFLTGRRAGPGAAP